MWQWGNPDLDKGRQAVGGAGGIGDDVIAGAVVTLVDAHDVGGDVAALGRGRDQDLLSACLQVLAGPIPVQEHSSALNDQIDVLRQTQAAT